MVRWFKSLFAWHVVLDSGVYLYKENSVTGSRTAVKYARGWQPLDWWWLTGNGRASMPVRKDRIARVFPYA